MADSAYQLALKRLSLRETSVRELRTYLRKKGFPTEEIETAIAALLESGTLDEKRFLRAFVRHHAMRGKGPAYITAKLKEKGIHASSAEIRGQFEENSEAGEAEAIRALLERRYPSANRDTKSRQKAYQALLRRGFTPSAVQAALRALGAPAATPDDPNDDDDDNSAD